MRLLIGQLAILLAGLGPLAGCGGSASTSSSNPTAPLAAQRSSSSTSVSATSRAAARRRTTHHRQAASTSTSTTSMSTAVTSTAPPPTPAGTVPAPDGLRQSTGYGSYELCAGACTGAVPAALRRPLHLPHGCAATPAGGPVSPQGAANIAPGPFIGSAWRAARVQWVAAGSYTGPVLIRGGRTDGPGAIGFGEGRTPYDELQLLAPGQQAPRVPSGGRAWLSFTRVRGRGCYAYQVDGTSFSEVIAFRAS